MKLTALLLVPREITFILDSDQQVRTASPPVEECARLQLRLQLYVCVCVCVWVCVPVNRCESVRVCACVCV